MKKFKLILYWLPAMILLLSGCSTEELVDTDTIREGEKAIIHLSVKAPDMKVYSRASLSDEDEKNISSLCVFIFDSNTGKLLGNTIHENAGVHASDGSNVINPDGSNYIAIETLTGNNRDIYVIANYHSCTIENLKGVSTVDDVKQLVARTFGNPLSRDYGMVMIGTLLKQKVRANENILVPLQQMSAKITIKVINQCANLDITGWTVDGIPLKSYIFERQVGTDPNYHDASNIIDTHDYYYDFSDQSFPFEQTTESATPTDGTAYESTFYMLENRRGGRVEDRQDPPATAEKREDYQLKAWYAPDNSSRIRILGKLGGAQTSSICINHYLGANNTDDYNIYRSTHYTYTITIHSMNSIDIDTNIEAKELSLDITPAADLMNMDAHYDCRSFLLKTNDITDPTVKVSAEILESINSSTHAAWLNLAVFPSSFHHVRKNSDAVISLWQQEGEDNTYVRPKFIPDMLTRSELDGKLKAYMGSGLLENSSEANYPSNDESLPYSKATHRMCKKITDIPTGSGGLTSPVSLYIYAKEYDFEASATAPSYREAVVRFTIQKGSEAPQYTHFTVRQYPPYRFAEISVNGTKYMLVTERMEEYEHFSQAQLPMSQQMSTGMQWGPYDLSGTTMGDGYSNTLKGVYTSDTGSEYFKTYLPKYGSNTSGWSITDNGKIAEGSGVTITTTGGPDFNLPDYQNSKGAYNAIYNSTAARYCHEKNRDMNGDGQIDNDETFWYLPSEQEMQLFWTYHEALNLYTDYYWSSTEADTNNAYAFSMQNSPASPHLTYNGVPQPTSKTTASGQKFPRVRCVRRVSVPTGANNVSAIRPIVSHRLDGTTVIDCSNLPNNMYTADTKMNINSTDMGNIQYANRQVYKRFEIQRKENAVADFNSLRQGNGKCDSSKGWRLPTQREMLMVYSVKSLLESNSGFEAFKSTGGNANYWTMTCDMSAQYIIDFSTGLCQYGNYFDAANKFYYRCVREVK